MRKNLRILAFCAWCLTLMVSCQGTNTTIPLVATATPANIWETLLSSASACEPPCWQGITPGTTNISEAASILERISDVTIKYQDSDSLSWYFRDNTEGGAIWASKNGTVSEIALESISDRKLLLETVVATYGSPQYVKPYDCREGMCVTALIYPDLGMFLSVFLPNTGAVGDPQFEILPSTTINRVHLLMKGIENFKTIPSMQHNDLLMEWVGYAKYP